MFIFMFIMLIAASTELRQFELSPVRQRIAQLIYVVRIDSNQRREPLVYRALVANPAPLRRDDQFPYAFLKMPVRSEPTVELITLGNRPCRYFHRRWFAGVPIQVEFAVLSGHRLHGDAWMLVVRTLAGAFALDCQLDEFLLIFVKLLSCESLFVVGDDRKS